MSEQSLESDLVWNNIKVTYFEEDKTKLVLDGIRPFLKEIGDIHGVRDVIVSPHWKLGPHVNVRIKCSVEVFSKVLLPLAKSSIGKWIEKNPSTREIVESDYVELSKKIALTEFDMPPYAPLLINNTVESIDYVVPDTIKNDDFKADTDEFLIDATQLSFLIMELREYSSDRCFMVLALMMGLVADTFNVEGYPAGIRRGFNTYRSHAEFFFTLWDKKGTAKKQFDLMYEKYRCGLQRHLMAIQGGDKSAGVLDVEEKEILAIWASILDKMTALSQTTVKNNLEELKSENIHQELAEKVFEIIPKEYQVEKDESELQKALETEEGQAFFRSEGFIVYRQQVNYFYLVLTMLSISAIQKFCLCHLVARTIEEANGETWKDFMLPEAV